MKQMTTCPLNTDTLELIREDCSLGHVNNYQCINFHQHAKLFKGKTREELNENYLFNQREVNYIVKTFKDKQDG